MAPLNPTLSVPRYPLSVERLALVLTGFTITGFTGITESVPAALDPASGCVPRGPYTITDAGGKVLHVCEATYGCAIRWAVRTWRQQEFDALPFGPADEREQLRLKAENRLLEAQIAANEARIAALNLPVDGDLDFLDRAMERYGEAVEAHRSALCRIEEHDDAQAAREAA
jgi:hypothetical protein